MGEWNLLPTKDGPLLFPGLFVVQEGLVPFFGVSVSFQEGGVAGPVFLFLFRGRRPKRGCMRRSSEPPSLRRSSYSFNDRECHGGNSNRASGTVLRLITLRQPLLRLRNRRQRLTCRRRTNSRGRHRRRVCQPTLINGPTKTTCCRQAPRRHVN